MFVKEKNQQSSEKLGTSATLISVGTELKGDVKSENDLRIDGVIYGNVTSSSKIVVGPTGYVEGNINSRQADVTGRVAGNITVQEALQLRAKCSVQGNLSANTLQIDPSAVFNGKCQMTGAGEHTNTAAANVVLMNADEPTAKAK
jgi:cytoskeletal protein CcmA (bactofilin family)